MCDRFYVTEKGIEDEARNRKASSSGYVQKAMRIRPQRIILSVNLDEYCC